MQPRFLIPNVGEDRTWPKARWKALQSYCRRVERILGLANAVKAQAIHLHLGLFGTVAYDPKTGEVVPMK